MKIPQKKKKNKFYYIKNKLKILINEDYNNHCKLSDLLPYPTSQSGIEMTSL